MSKVKEMRNGAEVSIEEGVGYVRGIDAGGEPVGPYTADMRNARVLIDADHLEHMVKGWVDTTDASVWQHGVQAAIEHAAHVRYRIVTKRRGDGTPRDTPIDKLGNKQKIREVEVLEILSDQPPGSPAARYVAEELAKGDGSSVARANGHKPPEQGSPPVHEAGAVPPAPASSGPPDDTPRRGPRIEEGKPWEPTNSDGSTNLGSYAVTAAVGMVELAHELALKAWDNADITEMPSREKIQKLARALLAAADRTQAAVRADGHVDRQDASHTRARGAVRAAVAGVPIPWTGTPEEKKAWVEELTAEATAIFRMALELL